jgi:5-methylcytosine-specific restriction protein B
MNTADRSLAGLDIALRRRFTFKEMPPKPELLDGIGVHGVDIGKVLQKMNERIEVLLDRDHCLGHAYFMPLIEDRTLDNLAFIFRQQILPLLQEYFFEDWERIAWVLNDQAKSNEYAFVQKVSINLDSLFGAKTASELQNEDKRWRINEDAFGSIESYKGILGLAV